jgi:hypothetical protein
MRRHREKKQKTAASAAEAKAAAAAAGSGSDEDVDVQHDHFCAPAGRSPAPDAESDGGEQAPESDAEASSDGSAASAAEADDAFEEESAARPRGRPKSVIELSKSLFDGSECSLIQGIELLLQLQARHKLTDGAMAELFDVLNLLLPKSNLVTYAVAKRVILDLGAAQLEFVDCCVNDCVLYRNAKLKYDTARVRQLADAAACPICNEPRFVKGKARKVLRTRSLLADVHLFLQRFPYMPLVPQLLQLYRRKGGSARLQLQPERKSAVMESLWDSPGWKAAVPDSGFSKERRNIALGMSGDGVNPFKKMQHSMWPILFLVRGSELFCRLCVSVVGWFWCCRTSTCLSTSACCQRICCSSASFQAQTRRPR